MGGSKPKHSGSPPTKGEVKKKLEGGTSQRPPIDNGPPSQSPEGRGPHGGIAKHTESGGAAPGKPPTHSGGSGNGGPAKPPAKPPQTGTQGLTKNQRSIYDFMQSTLKAWGLSSLMPAMR